MLKRLTKNPKVEFFTKINALPEVEPVVPGGKAMPNWWKKAPGTIPNTDPRLFTGTAKVCPAFPEFYSSGYVVPLWCDIFVDCSQGEPRGRSSAHDMFDVQIHSPEQFLNYAPGSVRQSTVAVLKLVCPWFVRTSPGYSMLQLPVFYEFDPRFTTMMGMIRTDTHHVINQQIMIHERSSFVLERGTPIAMYIPYKREEYQFSVKEVTEEFERDMQKSHLKLSTKFRRGYKRYTGS